LCGWVEWRVARKRSEVELNLSLSLCRQVVSCAVNVICELANKNPKNYLSMAPQFFRLLTTSSNNWMLIKVWGRKQNEDQEAAFLFVLTGRALFGVRIFSMCATLGGEVAGLPRARRAAACSEASRAARHHHSKHRRQVTPVRDQPTPLPPSPTRRTLRARAILLAGTGRGAAESESSTLATLLAHRVLSMFLCRPVALSLSLPLSYLLLSYWLLSLPTF
jgi:hypothetical protein